MSSRSLPRRFEVSTVAISRAERKPVVENPLAAHDEGGVSVESLKRVRGRENKKRLKTCIYRKDCAQFGMKKQLCPVKSLRSRTPALDMPRLQVSLSHVRGSFDALLLITRAASINRLESPCIQICRRLAHLFSKRASICYQSGGKCSWSVV